MRMWLRRYAVCLRGGCIRLLCSGMRKRMRMRQHAAGCSIGRSTEHDTGRSTAYGSGWFVPRLTKHPRIVYHARL